MRISLKQCNLNPLIPLKAINLISRDGKTITVLTEKYDYLSEKTETIFNRKLPSCAHVNSNSLSIQPVKNGSVSDVDIDFL